MKEKEFGNIYSLGEDLDEGSRGVYSSLIMSCVLLFIALHKQDTLLLIIKVLLQQYQ